MLGSVRFKKQKHALRQAVTFSLKRFVCVVFLSFIILSCNLIAYCTLTAVQESV